ncbi:hypothetical protein SH601_11080 [Gracilibacillus sp. S3-1-1]|uniref:Uncharacterized protein n=1 Tax=Gracilibacillus pellucidus TaxID=3095368 RepID=A0ACC6M6L6_9BACI|nr:hypothetical protein [Gracilibacillus sp. S3-1-1]MDX8046526.1 hypothetical protein [Gracilibacillus sp. S3-1-1]
MVVTVSFGLLEELEELLLDVDLLLFALLSCFVSVFLLDLVLVLVLLLILLLLLLFNLKVLLHQQYKDIKIRVA